jgi:hypothetical protein
MAHIGTPVQQIIQGSLESIWEDSNKRALDAKNYHELCEWLQIAHPEVWNQYKCVKDIGD